MLDKFRIYSFVLAVALITATQSRNLLGGIGVGEVFALIFIFFSAKFALKIKFGVLVLGSFLLVFGILIADLINNFRSLSDIRVTAEYYSILFAASFGLCSVAWLSRNPEKIIYLYKALILGVFVQLMPLLLLLVGIVYPAWMTEIDGESVLPFSTRYIGFSNNPNQIGIFICAIPQILIYAFSTGPAGIRRYWMLVGLLSTFLLSVLINSNTVFVVYACSALVYSFFLIFEKGRENGPFGFYKSLTLIVLCASVGLVLIVFYVLHSVDKTGDGSANGRFERYQTAFVGIQQSYGLGVGPGGQSGEVVPFEGTEAHNFYLDILAQGGFLSFLGYLILFIYSASYAIRDRSRLGLIVFLSICIQQLSHYTARQPLNWLYFYFPVAFLYIDNHRRSLMSVR